MTRVGKDYHQKIQDKRPVFSVDKRELTEILDGKNPQKLVDFAERFARDVLITTGDSGNVNEKRSVSTSQIRNIYGTVKSLEAKGKGDVTDEIISKLVLLKPKIAYAAGRHKKDVPAMLDLQKVLCESIDIVSERKDRFLSFCNFFESILAYHRYYGGK